MGSFRIFHKSNEPEKPRSEPSKPTWGHPHKARKRVKDRFFYPEALFAPGEKRILRIFPERTAMTPDDSYVAVGHPPLAFAIPPPELVDEVHISVTFTWHKELAERLLKPEWEFIYPGKVRVGGPAYESIECPAMDFKAGSYLKKGVTLTSRGCPNHCWFCFVPKREGRIHEMPIMPGFHVQDNNLTACSKPHVEMVFKMLSEQKDATNFTGGLECARLLSHAWFVDLLVGSIKHIRQIFVAFDDEARNNVTHKGIGLLRDKGFTRRQIRCFVLAGYPENKAHDVEADTIDKAINRCERVWEWGGLPFMMLYRGADFQVPLSPEWRSLSHEVSGPWGDPNWRKLQNLYTSPALMFSTHHETADAEDKKDEDIGLIPGDLPEEVRDADKKSLQEEIKLKLQAERIQRKRQELARLGQEEMFAEGIVPGNAEELEALRRSILDDGCAGDTAGTVDEGGEGEA
jgi:hypothetical protein